MVEIPFEYLTIHIFTAKPNSAERECKIGRYSKVCFICLSSRITDLPADVNVYFQISAYSRLGRSSKGEISFMMKTTKCSPGKHR